MGRKKARDNAFKCIYQLEFYNKDEIKLDELLEYCFLENENDESEIDYIKYTLNGVFSHLQEIDNIILAHLKNFKISRIAKIDLAILRLAIFELKFDERATPIKVVANEAVELSKTYGNIDSKSFVNGVIAKVIESIE